MNLELLVTFVGFTIVASVTPGPNNFLVLASSATFGWRRTAPLVAGIALGFAFMIGAVAIGLGALLQQVPMLMEAVRFAGVAWMVWLAWKMLLPALRPNRIGNAAKEDQPTRPLTLFEGAAFQWVNPKAWAVTMAAAAAYTGLSPEPVARAATMMMVFAFVGPICVGLWCAMGEGLRHLTGEGTSARVFSGAMALLLFATALTILFARP